MSTALNCPPKNLWLSVSPKPSVRKLSPVYDCPYPRESINQSDPCDMEQQQQQQRAPPAQGGDYECIYFGQREAPVNPWQYSPLYGVSPSPYYPAGFYPVQVDPWRQPYPYPSVPSPSMQVKSYSMDRLNMNSQRPQAFPCGPPPHSMSLRSPNPSPVHTPSSSPVLGRTRFSPSPGTSPAAAPRNAGNARRVLPGGSPVLPIRGAATGKPPKPRQRPLLQKARTVDNDPLDDLSAQGRRGSSPMVAMPPAMSSKVPSLDSLYEQLKSFAAFPVPSTDFVSDTRERASTYSGPPLTNRTQFKPDVEERLQRLEGDKDSLQMQVSVLMEQIDAQTEKIRDLEKSLTEKSAHLQRAEEQLQKELMARSSMETNKLELLSEMSSFKLRYAALERENLELRGQLKRSEQDMLTLVGQCYSLCGATLGPGANRKDMIEALKQNLRTAANSSQQQQQQQSRLPTGSMTSVASPVGTGQLRKGSLPASPSISSLPAAQSLSPQSPATEPTRPTPIQASKTPPASVFRKIEPDPFNSLPRQTSNNTNNNNNSNSNLGSAATTTAATTTATPKRTVVFAETEKTILEQSASSGEHEDSISEARSPIGPGSPVTSKNPKGLKKIFDKLKRSNSGALEGEPSDGEFRRGGTRATSGPRLGWNGHVENSTPQSKEPVAFFSDWTTDEVCTWLHEMGFHMYVYEAQRWVSKGQVLLTATSNDIEKELGIKNPLHKKKLILALEAKGCAADPASPIIPLPELIPAAGKLDHQWVVRWLDDIGLPQYKDAFLEARVDGRVLHALSIEDLCVHLKINNVLHVASVRRGIQVLRTQGYNTGCLKRRSVPEDTPCPTALEVALWTNHRVMEWLRAADLSEYAPNMRGSGIHGGLMVYEPRFNAELLATLLSIPQGKTLLRRHLATHFNQLVGREVVQAKRDMESSPGFVPLSPLSKVKVIKKSQFTLKRRKGKNDEYEADDWVCPSESNELDLSKSDLQSP